jgi:putative phage-type endonuclease
MARRGSVYLIERPGLLAIPTQNLAEAKWLELRRGGIGGSDIAAIMGESPWRSALAVYCDKANLVPEREATEAMEFGTMMEPTLRQWAELKINGTYNGSSFKVFSSPYMYRLEQQQLFLADVDGMVLTVSGRALQPDETEWAGLELKTVDRYASKEWKDGATPYHYQLQVNWYMGITGVHRWVVAPLLGKRFEIRVLTFNEELWRDQQQAAAGFWTTYVEPRQFPPATGKDGALLLELYKEGITEDIVQAPEFREMLETYQQFTNLIKTNEKHKEELGAKIKQRIGNNRGLQADGWMATWSRYDQERVDTKKLKADYPEVHKAVVKSIPSGRLNVKGSKEEEE